MNSVVPSPGRVLAHLVAFAACAWVAFLRNSEWIFHGLDGRYIWALVEQQHDWTPLRAGLGMNPLQGIGNVTLAYNFNLAPAYWLARAFDEPVARQIAAYTVFSVEFFVAVLLAGAVARLSWSSRLLGAWVVTPLALPMIPGHELFVTFNLIPHFVDLVLLCFVILWLLDRIGRGTRKTDLLASIAMCVGALWMVSENASLVVTVVPVLGALAAAIVFERDSVPFRNRRLAALLGSVIALHVGGVFEFVLGLYRYTVPGFNAAELVRNQESIVNASIAFFGTAALALVILAAAGVLEALVFRRGRMSIGVASAGLFILFVGGGYLLVQHGEAWRGPQMFYFEVLGWPIYAAYAGHALSRIVSCSENAVARLRAVPQLPGWGGIALGSVCLLVAGPARSPANAGLPWRVERAPLVDRLERDISLIPGQPFRGYAASFTALSLGKRGLAWSDIHPYDYEVVQRTGNDHRLVGLWKYRIPTLQEYNQFLTPEYYVVVSRLLGKPDDRQVRIVVIQTNPHQRLLAALGVRYVLADVDLPSPASLRGVQNLEGMEAIRLYEIAGVNLGQFSPTWVTVARDAAEVLDGMRTADLAEVAFTLQPVDGPLRSAQNATLRFDGGGYHATATSAGRSLLVLPIHYSRCLVVSRDAGEARLVRTNLFQTGVVFNRVLDARIEFRFGPLTNSSCRLEDLRDSRESRLSALARR